jgi:hypothetical protein
MLGDPVAVPPDIYPGGGSTRYISQLRVKSGVTKVTKKGNVQVEKMLYTEVRVFEFVGLTRVCVCETDTLKFVFVRQTR